MKSVTVEKAEQSSLKFWEWCNTTGGLPEHYPDEEVVRFLMPNRGKKLKVLDLGCGSGKNTGVMAGLGYDVHGCDYSQPGLDYTAKRLKERGASGSLQHVDFRDQKLPYADGTFDMIVAVQVYDHVLDKHARALIKETARILKPGGRLLATMMTTNTTKRTRIGHPLEGEENTMLVSEGNSSGEIHRLFRPEQTEAFFAGLPLEIKSKSTITQRFDATGEANEARYFVLEKKS